MKTNLHFFFILTILSTTLVLGQKQEAKYSITFTSVWNAMDHGTLPPGPHWSKLVGATHKTSGVFLEIAKKASNGIKDIAERGNNTVFNMEVTNAINTNEANQYINGSGLSTATGNIKINDLIVDKNYPLLTLVSMIAPSPDWMIAINGIELLDENNEWKSLIDIDLFPYDAGTDNGTSYTSANSVTDPIENITSLKNSSPFNDQKIGTLTISLTETLSTTNNIDLEKSISAYYNPKNKEIILSNKNNIEISNIEIYTILGKNVKSEIWVDNLIPISTFPNGVYILKILTNKGIILKKIIKH
jgi:hypothetical protein